MTKPQKIDYIQQLDPSIEIDHYQYKGGGTVIRRIWDPGSGLRKMYTTTPDDQKQANEDLNFLIWSLNNGL